MGYNPQGHRESDITEQLTHTHTKSQGKMNESQSLCANLGRTMLSNYCFEFYTFKWETAVWFLLFFSPGNISL